MTEFEKWEATHSPGEYAYQKWEEAWKAALEWAADQIRNNVNGYFNILEEIGK